MTITRVFKKEVVCCSGGNCPPNYQGGLALIQSMNKRLTWQPIWTHSVMLLLVCGNCLLETNANITAQKQVKPTER